MKVDVKFTHRGFFHGCPIYISFDRATESFTPLEMIPFTGWWVEYVAPAIQWARSWLVGVLDIDSEERDSFTLHRVRKLKKPFTKTFDWPEQ